MISTFIVYVSYLLNNVEKHSNELIVICVTFEKTPHTKKKVINHNSHFLY